MSPRETHQIRSPLDHRAAFRCGSDRHSASATEFEEAFVAELAKRSQDRVRVDLEDGSEVFRRRQPFARFCLAVRDRAAELGSNLGVKLDRIVAVHLDGEHGASHSSSIVSDVSMTASPEPRRSFLQAVIEEARKRARRRRTRYALLALLVAGAGATAYLPFRHGAGGGAASAARTFQRIDVVPAFPLRANGALTIMDVPRSSRQSAGSGWYQISTVDRFGRLHRLVRCPRHVRWCGELESLDWSPDGQRLAFGVTSFGAKNPFNGIHVVNLQTGGDHQIVRAGRNREHDWEGLDWSPDGKRLAYTSGERIVVINADGSSRKVLRPPTNRFDRSPSWSPDGAWIAFASSGPQEYPGIWAMRADGSQRRQLVRSGAAPAWSPDGTRIAFHAPRAQIEFVSPNGTLLSPRPPFRRGISIGINAPPLWSPDGKKIAMSSLRYGTYVMNADGTGLMRLTPGAVGVSPLTGQPPRPAWRPVAGR